MLTDRDRDSAQRSVTHHLAVWTGEKRLFDNAMMKPSLVFQRNAWDLCATILAFSFSSLLPVYTVNINWTILQKAFQLFLLPL